MDKIIYKPVSGEPMCSQAYAARTLGVSPQAVSQMVKRGELTRIDGMIPVQDVNWMRKERIRLAFAEYERLRDIPEIPAT